MGQGGKNKEKTLFTFYFWFRNHLLPKLYKNILISNLAKMQLVLIKLKFLLVCFVIEVSSVLSNLHYFTKPILTKEIPSWDIAKSSSDKLQRGSTTQMSEIETRLRSKVFSLVSFWIWVELRFLFCDLTVENIKNFKPKFFFSRNFFQPKNF